MNHRGYLIAGSFHRSCHAGGHRIKTPNHMYGNNHGRSAKIHHEGFNMCHPGRCHTSHHHGGSSASHHVGFHFPALGRSHISHHKFLYACSHHGRSQAKHHRMSHEVHHGDHCKAMSVHGGSGGKGISISKHAHRSAHGTSQRSILGHHHGLFNVNEKETMQHLNDRLASYLDKVRSLEQQNARLEGNIQEWYERNQPSVIPDFSCFFRTIQELQSQIASASTENDWIILQIDNARLATSDYQNKYEMEQHIRRSVEADVDRLRLLLELLTQEICHLRTQVRNLQEELQQIKRSHEEEVNTLQAQLGARVNVQMEAAPSTDLNRTLSEIREQYENLMERNLREVETIFRKRTEELNGDVASGSEELQSVQTEIIDLRRAVQTLEIELQSQLGLKSALENTLTETEATFGAQLHQLQCLINGVESQLAQIRSELERLNQDYKILMDQKSHLEMEIATYKRLLDSHTIDTSSHHGTRGKDGSHHTTKTHHVTSQLHPRMC